MRASSPDAADLAATIELLGRLIAHPTVSARSNRALIDDVAAWLRARDIGATIVEGGTPGKAGLIARVGPPAPAGVVLSGHTDVVPVEGQRWTSDPFALVERDGRLYGRGSADMKGFIAAVLTALPRFAAMPLRRPIYVALSWDEEVGCLGAPRLIEALLEQGPRPALVVVGEPTGMRPADRHRGIATFATTVTGRGGHSAQPLHGVNAIALAARFVAELERQAGDWAGDVRHPTDAARADPATLNIGRIEGGTAVNIIPEQCRLIWECRTESTAQVAALLAHLEAFAARELVAPVAGRAPETTVRTEPDVAVPPFLAAPDSPAVALALHLTGEKACTAAPFVSEAGLFANAGMAAVVLGPGEPAQAHRPDEFISREQLARCVAFLHRLGAWVV